MKKANEEKAIPMNEDGTPVEEKKEKKINLKKIGKTVLIGIAGAAAGIVAFMLVGAAMYHESDCDGESSTDAENGVDSFTTDTPAESSDCGSTEG